MKPQALMMPVYETLAPYAARPDCTRGRKYPEPESGTRTVHQRDRDRIIHCAAFRRLEYKTQVFVNHEGDHYRTRLTHSLEVSQLARSLCRCLKLNEDLGEALALAHDLGHTPFGHAGEDSLDEAMSDFGGFDHNAQTLRILTHLEHRYADFDGLNLTWETLEGVAKHNGPLLAKDGTGEIPRAMAFYARSHDLELHSYASVEAQLSALADDIAYHNHDMEDGLRAGFFTLEELETLPLVSDILAEVRAKYPSLDSRRLTHEMIRRLINRMVEDLLNQTQTNLKQADVASYDEVRALGRPVASFSPAMQEIHLALRAFLMKNMYRHYRVNRMTSKARRVVKELFEFFMSEPNCMPSEWFEKTDGTRSQQTAEVVADFIAGMTDRFALQEHARIFDVKYQG